MIYQGDCSVCKHGEDSCRNKVLCLINNTENAKNYTCGLFKHILDD